MEPTLEKKGNTIGIYIHYPYCVQKCQYCDFYSIGSKASSKENENLLFQKYSEELKYRLEEERSLLELEVDTVFIGGGTPSLASVENYAILIDEIRSSLKVSSDAEISIEINPEDLDLKLLDSLEEVGFNRINVGIQSFQAKLLKNLDRFYNEEKYQQVLEVLSSKPNLRRGIDLIYGIPEQTEDMFYSDLELAISQGLQHISLYSLTVEKDTPYERKLLNHSALPPNEELQEVLLLTLPDFMEKRGYRQYEVSNYSLPGYESKHNLRYWCMEAYLGLGPGAHAYTQKGRYANPRSVEAYLRGNYGTYELSEYYEELILSLFRLFLPFRLSSFIKELEPELHEKMIKTILNWQKKGYCDYREDIFLWKKESVLHLDSFILELASLKES